MMGCADAREQCTVLMVTVVLIIGALCARNSVFTAIQLSKTKAQAVSDLQGPYNAVSWVP